MDNAPLLAPGIQAPSRARPGPGQSAMEQKHSHGLPPRSTPEAFSPQGSDETWPAAQFSITVTMLTGMSDTVLPTTGSTLRKG